MDRSEDKRFLNIHLCYYCTPIPLADLRAGLTAANDFLGKNEIFSVFAFCRSFAICFLNHVYSCGYTITFASGVSVKAVYLHNKAVSKIYWKSFQIDR